MRNYFRQIDRVTVKGSVEPLGNLSLFLYICLDLYTCDLDINNLALEPVVKGGGRREAKIKRVKARLARDKYRELCYSGEIQASGKFETDRDLITMRANYTQVIYL